MFEVDEIQDAMEFDGIKYRRTAFRSKRGYNVNSHLSENSVVVFCKGYYYIYKKYEDNNKNN